MSNDPIVQEKQKEREEPASEHKHDVETSGRYLREKQQNKHRVFVRISPEAERALHPPR
ncbi:hypothetical protein GMJAKD_07285 [Candidatus Electrothrix aarhusensis]